MILSPKCYIRKCEHFIGVKQPKNNESLEYCHCKAFPKGIPFEIAYGKNLHIRPYSGDNGIQFEPMK